jgi:hypothetical protein
MSIKIKPDHALFIYRRLFIQLKKEMFVDKEISKHHADSLLAMFRTRGGSFENLALGAGFEANLISDICKSYVKVLNARRKAEKEEGKPIC